MSIDSIGPNVSPRAVRPTPEAVAPQKEAQSVAPQQEQKEEPKNDYPPVDSPGMSTQDFMSLRAQTADEPFKVLDEVISKMKENMEQVGDALEAMSEMVEKTSKDNLALKLLEKTLEAMGEEEAEE